jgi:hypothetical protein
MNPRRASWLRSLVKLAALLSLLPLGTQAETSSYKGVFQAPSYPGTEPFNGTSSALAALNRPFATSLAVFKTKDGAPLDAETVIQFYKSYYEKKGWQKGIFERRGSEPYLGMRVQVYESDGKGPSVHVAGEVYLWVAPRDGMITIYMSQWRISSLDQKSKTEYAHIEDILKLAGEEHNCSVGEASSYGDWQDYYQNEYLIECKVFTFRDKSVSGQGCLDGGIYAVLAAYKDAIVAAEQAKEFSSTRTKAIPKGNILLLLRDLDGKKAGLIGAIAKKLQ